MNPKLFTENNSLNVLSRIRINNAIDNAIQYNKILYLFAPIAWGKTTTVRNYANIYKHKVEWLDLKDESINVKDFFISCDDFKTIIILDNIQEVKDKKSLNKLVGFIRESPEYYKFIILGRNKPPVYFSEFIVKGQIKILTAEDLSFTKVEIKEFYLENGLELNNSEIEKISHYTEGWPAVMAIILMLLKFNSSASNLISETNEYMENFIEENIWNKWDDNYKNFFMSISLFKELPINLCIELSEQYKVIDFSEQFSINKANDSYKMNSVLCSFLKNKAQIHISDKIHKIYESIGVWFEKNNYEIEAIDSYYKANKIQKILEMLEKNYDKHIRISNINDIGKYLKKIINETHGYSPVICTLMAMFEIINCNFDKGQKWYRELIKMKETCELNSEEQVDISLKVLYIKLNVPNTKYREIIKIYYNLLNEMPKENFPIKSLGLTEGLPSIIRGIKDYYKIGRHYKLIKKILSPKIRSIYGDNGLILVEAICAELEYARNNLNYALIILIKQLDKFKSDQIDTIFTLNIIMERVICATGDIEKCEDIMDKLKTEIVKNKAFYLLKNYNSVYARLALLKGDINNAEKFLINCRENKDIEITCLEMHQYLTKVRIYIATGKYQRAIMLIKKLYEVNLKHDYILNVIECYILEAISLYKSYDKGLALEKMYKALKLAQPYSYIRIFADEGKNAYVILNKYAKLKHEDINEEYLKDVLIETRAFAQLYPKYLEEDTEINNLKLTKAEVEIIHLLNKGMSNSDICDYLNIKIDTVKFHTKNLYAKLGVKSRLRAVQIAKNKKIIE